MSRVIVKPDKCIGCGTCVALCPEVFELKEDGKAHVKAAWQGEKEELPAGVKESAASCPTEAIILRHS